MVALLNKATDEAVANKRRLILDPKNDQFGIELLPSDTVRLAVLPSGRPVLLDAKTDAPITSFSGTVGLPPLVILGIVVVVGLAAYGIVDSYCSNAAKEAHSKMLETVSTEGKKLVESKKATPEQVASMDKALFDGAATVEAAKAKGAEAEDKWPKTIRTVGFVALGIAAIWLVGSMFAGGGARRAAATPTLVSNPKSYRRSRASRRRALAMQRDQSGRFLQKRAA
jgi:hypothetical protein